MNKTTNENETNELNKYPILSNEKIENSSIGNSLADAIRKTEKVKEFTNENVKLYKVDMKLLKLDIKNEYVINIKTGVLYKIEGVRYKGKIYHNLEGVEVQEEPGNSLIDLSIEIKQETDTLYKTSLTFKATDENDKIEQIEYLPKEGEVQVIIPVDKEGKQEIPIDYDIEKTDIDKNFRVRTKSGNVEIVNTAYTVTYDNNMGEVFKEDKILKGSVTKISIPNIAPTNEGKHFLGWSKYRTATEPDYFENGEYAVDNKNITFYAIWEDKQSGKTEELNNDSLLGKVSKINTSGVQNIEVNGVTYSANIIVKNNDLVLDGEEEVTGATLTDKIYEFGNKETDVAKINEDKTIAEAQNIVILKVNGNLTINESVTITTCKSDNGYGGPKGFFIYCTETLTNNGTIDMTARGARAEGQDVYLWKNEKYETEDKQYEYVPKEGANGGKGVKYYNSSIYADLKKKGSQGENGDNRKTGGGASGGVASGYKTTATSGSGSSGTSYSGGSGGGGATASTGSITSQAGQPNGSKGGNAAKKSNTGSGHSLGRRCG